MTWCVNKKILKAIDWTLRIAPELFYPFNGRPHRSQVHEERLAADSGRSSGSWFVLLLTPSRPGRLGALGQWPIVRFVPTHSGGTARELHPFPYARIYAFCALNLKRGPNQSQGNSGRMRNRRPALDNRYAMLTAFGQDRPGIVAALAEGLYHLGCNIEDTCMTRLRDEFAMMLLVRLPAGPIRQLVRSEPSRQAHQQHHGKLVPQACHAGIFDITAKVVQPLGEGRDDAGTVLPEGSEHGVAVVQSGSPVSHSTRIPLTLVQPAL